MFCWSMGNELKTFFWIESLTLRLGTMHGGNTSPAGDTIMHHVFHPTKDGDEPSRIGSEVGEERGEGSSNMLASLPSKPQGSMLFSEPDPEWQADPKPGISLSPGRTAAAEESAKKKASGSSGRRKSATKKRRKKVLAARFQEAAVADGSSAADPAHEAGPTSAAAEALAAVSELAMLFRDIEVSVSSLELLQELRNGQPRHGSGGDDDIGGWSEVPDSHRVEDSGEEENVRAPVQKTKEIATNQQVVISRPQSHNVVNIVEQLERWSDLCDEALADIG